MAVGGRSSRSALRLAALEVAEREAPAAAAETAATAVGEVEPLMCVVCMAEPITHVMFPCEQHCVCEDRPSRLREAQMPCPLCKEPFTNAMRVYAAGVA